MKKGNIKAQKQRRLARRKAMGLSREKGNVVAQRQRRIARMKTYVDNLKDNPCVDCGNHFYVEDMQFDHTRDKYRNVAAMTSWSKARVDAEIAKCDLVCKNCHQTRTNARRVSS